MKKLVRLMTPIGNIPNLSAIEEHLSQYTLDLGRVLVQEVHFHVYSDNDFDIPLLEHGHINGFKRMVQGLDVLIGESSVLFPQSEELINHGVARVIGSGGIIYEDQRLVKNWDTLLKKYEHDLKKAGDTFLPGLSPLGLFKEMCPDRMPYFSMYLFFKNKQGVYEKEER